MPATAALDKSLGQSGDTGPPTIDAETTRRSVCAAKLPLASPTLARRLESTSAARDPASVAATILDEPAALLAVYAEARRRDLAPSVDLASLIDALGEVGIGAVAASLARREPVSPTGDGAALAMGLRHALATARLAAHLAPAAGLDPDTAAAAGLLHDVGRLALLAGPIGGRVAALYAGARDAATHLPYLEHALLGLTHAQAGYEYARRFGTPELVAEVARTHDWRSAQRRRLAIAPAALGSFIQLCDTLARSHGYGGCEADALGPVPPEYAALAPAGVAEVLAGVDDTMARHWLPTVPPPTPAHTPLAGIAVGLLASSTATWSPAAAPLARAGARLVPADRASAGGEPHVLVIDGLDAPLAATARVLRSPAVAAFPGPRLVLADRAADAGSRLAGLSPGVSILTTPVRPTALLHRVHELAPRLLQ